LTSPTATDHPAISLGWPPNRVIAVVAGFSARAVVDPHLAEPDIGLRGADDDVAETISVHVARCADRGAQPHAGDVSFDDRLGDDGRSIGEVGHERAFQLLRHRGGERGAPITTSASPSPLKSPAVKPAVPNCDPAFGPPRMSKAMRLPLGE
jgi:hypothetical protein